MSTDDTEIKRTLKRVSVIFDMKEEAVAQIFLWYGARHAPDAFKEWVEREQ